MSLKQMRFQVTSKLIRPNSWITQTLRRCWRWRTGPFSGLCLQGSKSPDSNMDHGTWRYWFIITLRCLVLMKLRNANSRECVEPNVLNTETARFLVVGHENVERTRYFTLQIFHAYRWATAVVENISVLRIVDDWLLF